MPMRVVLPRHRSLHLHNLPRDLMLRALRQARADRRVVGECDEAKASADAVRRLQDLRRKTHGRAGGWWHGPTPRTGGTVPHHAPVARCSRPAQRWWLDLM
eukprot:330937-Chlamydomonas_euryale.AAC.1